MRNPFIRLFLIGLLGCVVHASQSFWVSALRSDGRCKSLELFSIPCPGCHGTRSLIALSRGDVFFSIQENILPSVFLFFILLWCVSPSVFQKTFEWMNVHWIASLALVGVLLLFQWGVNLLRAGCVKI